MHGHLVRVGLCLVGALGVGACAVTTIRPPSPHTHHENLSVFGAGETAIAADLRVDDGSTSTGVLDAQVTGLARLAFPIVSPPTHLGWGALLTVRADGYVPVEVRVIIGDSDHELPSVTLIRAARESASYTLEELAAIRGAMWTARWGGPLGPRPGRPDNILAMVFLGCYPRDQQLQMIDAYKARGYTHAVIGPLVDSDGYHRQYCVHDWRGDQWTTFLDLLELLWSHELIPVVFLHPDNWTFEQTRDAFTGLLQQPRAQQLIRVAVPAGWEPTRYGWSSQTWALFQRWGRETLPNALILIHTVTDVDAPVGTDQRGDDTGHPNAEGWARVAPWLHGWLTQSSAFVNPTGHDDPTRPTRTNFQNWQDLFNPAVRGSYLDRFQRGYAGWPTGSAWGSATPLRVYAGEYASFWAFWSNRPESEAMDWGDAAMVAGADGYLDGGRVPVPVR